MPEDLLVDSCLPFMYYYYYQPLSELLLDGFVMPHPRVLLGAMRYRPADSTSGGAVARTTREDEEACLRGTKGYFDLMVYFLKILVTAKVYKECSRIQRMSAYVRPGLESFLVLTYVNSYGCWMKAWEEKYPALAASGAHRDTTLGAGVATDGEITLYNGHAKLFTCEAKGGGKHKGWSNAGLVLHKKMSGVIKTQRAGQSLGAVWEDRLKSAFGSDIGVDASIPSQFDMMGDEEDDDCDDFFLETGNEKYLGQGPVEV